MGPSAPGAQLTLSYPLYAADFDPQNHDFLFVGGGGGEGRSGVGNRITLINASRRSDLSEIVEVDLGREEDNVTSLAVAESSDDAATIYAGINSSEAAQQEGRNEHFRSFRLDYPAKRKRGPDETTEQTEKSQKELKTTALGKASIFRPSPAEYKETFQRRLKLSPSKPNVESRLGVISTGLSPAGEVVIFNATAPIPSDKDVLRRISLEQGREAADVDIIPNEDDSYRTAYCTNNEVFIYDQFTAPREVPTPSSEPRFLYAIPHPDVFSNDKSRPTFRALRLLTPNLILLLQNTPQKRGAELLLLDVSRSGRTATIILRKTLPKSIDAGTNLATALLSPSPSTSNSSRSLQHVIAVSGKDCSLHVLTLDHSLDRTPSSRLKIRPHSVYKKVHPYQITALAFSTFNPPSPETTPSPPPQYLKLASASFGNTLCVHTFPLTPSPPLSSLPSSLPAAEKARKQRYVLQPPTSSEAFQTSLSVLISILVVALGAFFLQAFTEIRGGTPEHLGAKSWLPERIHAAIARPYVLDGLGLDLPVLPTTRLPSIREVVKSSATAVEDEVEGLATEAAATATQASHQAAHLASSAVDRSRGEAVHAQRHSLRALLRQRSSSSSSEADAEILPLSDDTSEHAIVVHDPAPDQPLSISVTEVGSDAAGGAHAHAPGWHPSTRSWEQLSEEQRERWKKRLLEAGEWTLEEGETVLKGVLFSHLGGFVGGAVGGVVGG